MERLRPDDHFMIMADSHATPMQIGALVLFDVPVDLRAVFARQLRAHLVRQLPATPLVRTRHSAPRGYDSDVWLGADLEDAALQIEIAEPEAGLDDARLRTLAAAWGMERLNLSRPPFQIRLYDDLAGGGGAMLIKVHHALMDGVGFQTLMQLLADDAEGNKAKKSRRERPPPAWLWVARSWLRFRHEAGLRKAAALRRAEAAADLKRYEIDPGTIRMPTPTLKLSGPTSQRRSYATLTLSFPSFRAAARRLDATINDLFLAVAGTALRNYLLGLGDLPDTPLVASAARSYRRPEHGLFGNRIVALHPHLATHLSDPLERLRSIQRAMSIERGRTLLDEAMLDQPEAPFGPRDRIARLAGRARSGARLLPGNVTLSNVPGPAEQPRFAGFRQTANYPIPLLATGRFLNITSRRNGMGLDLGIMADAEKVTDLDRLVSLVREAAALYESLAATTAVAS